jgi:hypothetical protein
LHFTHKSSLSTNSPSYLSISISHSNSHSFSLQKLYPFYLPTSPPTWKPLYGLLWLKI